MKYKIIRSLYSLLLICLILPFLNGCSSKLTREQALSLFKEYLAAVEKSDFKVQKEMTTGPAYEFTLFKEIESKVYGKEPKVTSKINNFKITKNENNTVEIALGVTLVGQYSGAGGVTASIRHIDGPVKLVRKGGKWVIEDYVRDGRKLSETVLQPNVSVEKNKLKFTLEKMVLLSTRSLFVFNVSNKNDKKAFIRPGKNFKLFNKEGKELLISAKDRALLYLTTVKAGDDRTGFTAFPPLDPKKDFPVKFKFENLEFSGGEPFSMELTVPLSK